MNEATALTWVERNGSFGLVTLIVLGAMVGGVRLFRWMKSDVVPKIFAHLENERAEREKQRAEHAVTLETVSEEHAQQLERRDAICREAAESNRRTAEVAAKTAEAVTSLMNEVKELKKSRQP